MNGTEMASLARETAGSLPQPSAAAAACMPPENVHLSQQAMENGLTAEMFRAVAADAIEGLGDDSRESATHMITQHLSKTYPGPTVQCGARLLKSSDQDGRNVVSALRVFVRVNETTMGTAYIEIETG